MDELSINSKTNKKIARLGSKQANDPNQSASLAASQKCHFRIDWRQLTYYQKEQRSLFSNLLCNNNKQQHHHHQQSVYFEDEEDEEDEDDDNYDGSQSYCGLSRTSELGRLSKRRPILNSLDGCFKSGELNAILGPSGAGKSTFLSALFGNKQESSYGQTKVTWFPSAPASSSSPQPPAGPQASPTRQAAGQMNKQRSIRIACLPQHDHLLNHLTVYETLMFASKIKNPHQASNKLFHRQNVKRVAKMLKLTSCFQTRCGRLSGGQYKRVSIGQELLSEPDLIILDEPTSGLDAMTCLTTIRTLKSIVLKHPISIVLTIHQPDIDVFNLFDRVYVIAQGGLAIYEGPPQEVVPTLARVGLVMPSENYNPARFIVENAFVADLDPSGAAGPSGGGASLGGDAGGPDGDRKRSLQLASGGAGMSEHDGHDETWSSTDEEEDEQEDEHEHKQEQKSFLRRSISSLTEALGGVSAGKQAPDLSPDNLMAENKRKFRDSGRRPLLNIGIQTADGKLITSDHLASTAKAPQVVKAANLESQLRKQQQERLSLLKHLNQMQRAKYYGGSSSGGGNGGLGTATTPTSGASFTSSDVLSQRTSLSDTRPTSADSGGHSGTPPSGSSSDSSSWSEAKEALDEQEADGRELDESSSILSASSATSQTNSSSKHNGQSSPEGHFIVHLSHTSTATTLNLANNPKSNHNNNKNNNPNNHNQNHKSNNSDHQTDESIQLGRIVRGRRQRMRRNFDKRLSAKHIQSKQSDYPIWYHTALLAHRTWLSIVRDPIFFGIQLTMHTTIPILLALIFGSQHEEGCPQVGNFDLVQFAYSDQADFIQSTMRSIRQSIGNIGIIFFEMFVLSFAINCITALVFPLDMYVLLKEYRNGWYSLRSYFFGRTLADLPVPVVLHSLAMSILCYMTGQPLTCWRFAALLGIVVLASLVAQSVGLTIGALLMRSSQSAVLAAAGIVAPFFALSGFIVRIHTLPWMAQLAAHGSYLYHLLNGFITLRYGYGRCHCTDEDFEPDESHQIPGNLKTMASIWIGTYSNEFEPVHSGALTASLAPNNNNNRTNMDPNIDIIDKLMAAFKMANSFGHKVDTCDDVLPYAMLDFNLKDADFWHCCLALVLMLLISRLVTFSAIYYKIRSFS